MRLSTTALERSKAISKQAGLLAGVAVLLLVARTIAAGGTPPVLIILGIVSVLAVALRPIVGVYLCFVVFVFVPYSNLRLDIPLFHSPLQLVVAVTLAGAVARQLADPKPLPRSPLYPPMAVVFLVFLAYAVVGHGETTFRLINFLKGAWPLPLVLLLADTPERAKHILFAMLGSIVALLMLWSPGLLELSKTNAGALGVIVRGGESNVAAPGVAHSLIGAVGGISFIVMIAFALAAPVLLGIALTSRKWRVLGLLGFAIVGGMILISTIASAAITLAVGSASVALILVFAPGAKRVEAGTLAAALIVTSLALLGSTLPAAQKAIDRISNPYADPSGGARLMELSQGAHAFFERPRTGFGPHSTQMYTPHGWFLSEHNSWVVLAWQYGLLLMVPLAWLLWRLGREYWFLVKTSKTPEERGVSAGMLASLLALLVTGFLTPAIGEVGPDTVMWTLVGVAIVWANWRRQDPGRVLLAPVGAGVGGT